MMDDHLATRLGDSIQSTEFEKKAQDEKKRYVDLIEKLMRAIINDEVKTQLPHALPKAVSDFANPVITSTVNESIENIVLAKSSSQPESTYEAATSLTEFEWKKILLDKMQKSQSYQGAKELKELYDGLVKPYKLDKDLFESYGKAYSIKRAREDKDKDEDPPAGSDQDRIAQAEKPHLIFDKLMSTPIDFSAYVMNNLKIDNLTLEHLIGQAFNLLKGTCRSRVELEYHFKECYKAVTVPPSDPYSAAIHFGGVTDWYQEPSPFGGLSDIGSPGVDGPPVMPEDPYAYVVATFQAPPSPDYVPSPEYPPLPEFVPESYFPESDHEEDPEEDDDEDPEEYPSDYPTDRDDDDEEEEEPLRDETGDEEEDEDNKEEDEDNEEEEEEHLVLVDSVPPPVHRVTARISIRPQTPVSLPSDTKVARLLAIPTPPSSPLSPWSSPLP
ncbi:hypothetical protein Tco_0858498 [Tanacetum coccineum]|uniref:Uncharacterized protein n=1 Tax=Tanacetum coccineum TaxID=301880 RepID=A0ABQ5BA19_9ASTR